MDLRAALFGSTLRIAVTAVLGLSLTVGTAFAVGVFGVPGVVGVENGFGDVTDTTTEIQTDVTVNNPNPIGLRLGGLGVYYQVDMNDVRMATGEKEGIGVGTGNSTLNFTTEMENDRIPPWWVSHIENDERTELTVNATASSGLLGRNASFTPAQRTIETDIISKFNSSETRPVNADTAFVEDPVAYVNRTNATWGAVDRAETPIETEFVVYNPKSYPLTVSEIGYNISMNDIHMGDGETAQTYTIPPGESRTLDASVVMRNENLDEWWVSHLERNQHTDLRIDFYARIELSSTTVNVPLRDMTYEETIDTDFFGNKDAAPTDGSTDGGDDTTERTTTDDSATDDSTTDDSTTDDTAGDSTTEATTVEGTTTDRTNEDGTTERETTTTDSGGILALDPRS